jgi:hypothetical protein
MPTWRILAVLLISLPAEPSDDAKDLQPSGNRGPDVRLNQDMKKAWKVIYPFQ